MNDYKCFDRTYYHLYIYLIVSSTRGFRLGRTDRENVSAKEEHVKKHSFRFTPFFELPYFNIIRQHAVDPMHCLFLGIAKAFMKGFSSFSHYDQFCIHFFMCSLYDTQLTYICVYIVIDFADSNFYEFRS